MEKGKKGSAIIERFRHLGDYVKKVGVAALVACGAIAPSAACSLEEGSAVYEVEVRMSCDNGDGDPNTNPNPSLSSIADIDSGNSLAGARMYRDRTTLVCPEGTTPNVTDVSVHQSSETPQTITNGDPSVSYAIKVDCPGDLGKRVHPGPSYDVDGNEVSIRTNGYCNVSVASTGK